MSTSGDSCVEGYCEGELEIERSSLLQSRIVSSPADDDVSEASLDAVWKVMKNAILRGGQKGAEEIQVSSAANEGENHETNEDSSKSQAPPGKGESPSSRSPGKGKTPGKSTPSSSRSPGKTPGKGKNPGATTSRSPPANRRQSKSNRTTTTMIPSSTVEDSTTAEETTRAAPTLATPTLPPAPTLAPTPPSSFAREALEQALKSPGCTAVGDQWGVKEMVERNGLFRGVYLAANVGNDALGTVAQFTRDTLAKTQEDLQKSIEVNTNAKTTEGSVSSSDTSAVQQTNSMISSYGASAFSSSSTSAGLGGSAGVASFGLSFGHSDSKSTDDANSNAQQKSMQKKVSTYAKTPYYMEPRSLLVVDAALIEPTPAFEEAVDFVSNGHYTAKDLFNKFGTHVCLKAQMGGWWRITAHAQSSDSLTTVSMDKQATSAISSAKSNSFSLSAGASEPGVGGASASVGHTSSKNNNVASSSSSKNDNSNEDSHTVLDVYQEWQGGQSGCTPDQWRKSLLPVMNSNWKVIDRHVDECIGIWQWIQKNATTKKAVCEAWRDMFIKEIGLKGGDSESIVNGDCTGSASMQDFRESLLKEKQNQDQAALVQKKQECLKRQGYYFDDARGVCKQNVCKCGAETGTTGLACATNGATSCLDSQKAKCSTMMCPDGFVKKDSIDDALCETNICGDADKDTCCQDHRLTNRFLLTIRTKDCCHCGTNKDVSAMIKGSKGEITSWQVLDTSGHNDFEQGDVGDYTVTASVPFIPVQLCMKSDGWCVTSDTPGVTIYNGALPKSVSSKIGDVGSFNKFDDYKVQCSNISPAN